jgi:hypothetical protein
MRKMRRIAVFALFGLCSLPALADTDPAAGRVSVDGAPLPETGLSDPLSTLGNLYLSCNWRQANGTPTPDNPKPIRYGYIELAAGYYQFFLSPNFPAGTRFRIDGQYPKARYFSYQLYDGSNTGVGFLPDYQVQPDPGSQSPYTGINTLDTAIKPGGRYSVHLVYGKAPATPAANTIYVDSSQFSLGSQAVFIYRIYNAFPGVAVIDHGGVPMPTVYKETAQGDVPLAQLDQTLVCDAGIGQRNARRVVRAQVSDWINAQPERPQPIPAQPVPAPPQFLLRDDPTDVLVNHDNRYIYAQLSQKPGDLVLMRFKAPSFATGPGAGSDPQLRHWSVCENAWVTVETYSCIEDSAATLDAGGYSNIVISVPAKRPPNALPAHGFDWLSYGTAQIGTPILRHMLASPHFTQSAFNVPSGQGAQAPALMGEYFPLATYCANTVFAAHTAAGETPQQVFAGCAAGK